MENSANSFQTSPQQDALWRAEPDGPSGWTQAVLELSGSLDVARLEAAVSSTVERHEVLRTTFSRRPGVRVAVQVVADELPPTWTQVDASDLPDGDQADRLKSLLAEQRRSLPAFGDGPLMRAVLVEWGQDRHALLLSVSGLCADGASATVLAREVVDHLGGLGQVPADPLQYPDFAAWQHELADSDSDERRAARELWAQARDAVPPALPFARAASPPAAATEEVAVDLSEQVATSLRGQADRYGTPLSGLVQAAWYVLLGRLSARDTAVIEYIPSERRHADLEGAIGVFSRPVPLEVTARGCTVAEALQEVKRGRERALVAQDYAPAAGAGALPVAFLDQTLLRTSAGGVSASLERIDATWPGLRLCLVCADSGAELSLRIDFDPGFLDVSSVERLARELAELLRHVAGDSAALVDELPLLDEGEREQILVSFNDTGVPAPVAAAHERFAACAAADPGRPAVVDEQGALTYCELDALANQLAHRLRRAGVAIGDTVGLCTDRSTEMVIGLLGILKAGAAYLPLHFEHPRARLEHQLATTDTTVIVTQEGLLERLPEVSGARICLDRDRDAIVAEPTSPPPGVVSPEQLAYVIFTSGSTGTPKGVGVTHANLSNYTAHIAGRLGADAEPLSFGLVTAISTDLGNTSVFGALCTGGTLLLVSPTDAADAGAFARRLAAHPVDVLKITPSHAGALLSGGDAGVLPRRWLVVGGESLTWDLVERVRSLAPECRILNHYGPTEATIGCCMDEVTEESRRYEPVTVPIGRPITATAAYLLDEHGQPVPIGVGARLFIAGAGVARGYVGAPELTAERFADDPFAPGRRMYDTGDLARWLPDGRIEFLGRVDEQVKIRGFRVEPAEVEGALRRHPAVREAVVLARAGAAGDTRLIAYCVADGVSGDDLQGHLATWVPDFMLPSDIVVLGELPRTPSGKVDRLALPDPAEAAAADDSYQAPRSPMEEAVAAIWARALGLERVGLDDDFFALGGHSLLATQVVAHVRSDFALDLPLHSLFSYPTVESLTAEIVRMIGSDEEDETARLLAELEDLSDEDAERRLAREESGQS